MYVTHSIYFIWYSLNYVLVANATNYYLNIIFLLFSIIIIIVFNIELINLRISSFWISPNLSIDSIETGQFQTALSLADGSDIRVKLLIEKLFNFSFLLNCTAIAMHSERQGKSRSENFKRSTNAGRLSISIKTFRSVIKYLLSEYTDWIRSEREK